MNNRSIVEINHDLTGKLDTSGQLFVQLMVRALRSGSPEAWKALEPFGIRRAVQCHHSEKRRVVVGSGSYRREVLLS